MVPSSSSLRIAIPALSVLALAAPALAQNEAGLKAEDRVPANVQVEDIRTALAEYVDFRGERPTAGAASTGDTSRLRKGMPRADVERLLGATAQSSRKTTGDVTVVTLVFVVGDDRVTAEFVEDVLVRYTIASK